MARSGAESVVDDPPSSGPKLWNQLYYPSDTPTTIQQKFTDWSGQAFTLAQATTDFNNYAQWTTLDGNQQTDNQNGSAFENDYGLNIWQGTVGGTQRYASPLNSTNQGPNFMCPPPIVPLTNNEQTILDGINSVTVVQGDWLPDQGMEWGWNTISPRWQGLWGGVTNANGLPKNYNTAAGIRRLYGLKGIRLLTEEMNSNMATISIITSMVVMGI